MRQLFAALAATVVLALAGCSDTGELAPGNPNNPNNPPPPPPVVDQSPGGAYSGQLMPAGSSAPTDIIGLIDETGFGFFYDINFGAYYQVQANPNGNLLRGTVSVIVPGQTAVTGTLSGALSEREAIAGFATTSRGSEAIAATYQAVPYELPSSFAVIGGNYQFFEPNTATTVTISINATGAVTTTDNFGCVYTGQLSIPDAAYNAYRFSGVYRCTGFADQPFSGLASFVPQDGATPAGIAIGLSDGVEFAGYAVASKL